MPNLKFYWLFICLISFKLCNHLKSSLSVNWLIMIKPKAPAIIAHRGASDAAPENTLSAIRKALELDVDFVEIDVRLSQDGVPILMHDESLARIAGSEHAPHVHHLSLPQLLEVDAGNWFHPKFSGEKIPTLAEVLALSWRSTGLMIEIKECPQTPEEVVAAVFDVLLGCKHALPRLVIGSFSLHTLLEVKKHLHRLKEPAEMIGIPEKWDMIIPFIEHGTHRLAIWHKLINPTLMHLLQHEKKIDVWTFTVNDVADAQSMISLGVKGIICDAPSLMLDHRSKFTI